jgi:hypothetical protein
MNEVDPQAWLTDVLARIAEHPVRKLNECRSSSRAAAAQTPRWRSSRRAPLRGLKTTRTFCARRGDVGCVFQAVGIALPPNAASEAEAAAPTRCSLGLAPGKRGANHHGPLVPI